MFIHVGWMLCQQASQFTGYQNRVQNGQVGSKKEKSGFFSNQISVHFGSASQNLLKSDPKKSRIFGEPKCTEMKFFPFGTNLAHAWSKSDTTAQFLHPYWMSKHSYVSSAGIADSYRNKIEPHWHNTGQIWAILR